MAIAGSAAANEVETGIGRCAIRKLSWRLVLPLTLGYLVAYIDRVNAGFAALQMNHDLGLSSTVYGVGAGIFFLSYVVFEIPSNLAQARLGGRRWIARIMVSWGIISGLMVFVAGPWSFYGVRLLLGAAEAGFFPGVVLYLTAFFPAEHRARIMALFAVAIPVSSLVGSPVSAALLGLDSALGLHGWQWMFLGEAVPSVLLGIALLWLLPESLAACRFLTAAEKAWIAGRLATDAAGSRVAHGSTWRVMANPYVLVLALALGGSAGVSQALALWQPQMIKAFGLTNMEVGLLNGIPFAIASVAMVMWGRRSDRHGERVRHTILPLALSAVALAVAGFVHGLAPFILVLCLILVGTYAMKGPFWGLAAEWLAGPAAVVGLAQVNSIGNVATFLTSTAIGLIRDATGNFQLALTPLMAVAALGCIALAATARRDRRRAAPFPAAAAPQAGLR
jgi:MFS transporter, ACS family, tartrate transporter